MKPASWAARFAAPGPDARRTAQRRRSKRRASSTRPPSRAFPRPLAFRRSALSRFAQLSWDVSATLQFLLVGTDRDALTADVDELSRGS